MCKYRDALGVPGRGVHAWRVGGVAIVDVILTVVAAGIIAWISEWNFWCVLGGLVVLGILMHRIFCVRTTVDRLLFSAFVPV
jgi:hypothetical protein